MKTRHGVKWWIAFAGAGRAMPPFDAESEEHPFDLEGPLAGETVAGSRVEPPDKSPPADDATMSQRFVRLLLTKASDVEFCWDIHAKFLVVEQRYKWTCSEDISSYAFCAMYVPPPIPPVLMFRPTRVAWLQGTALQVLMSTSSLGIFTLAELSRWTGVAESDLQGVL